MLESVLLNMIVNLPYFTIIIYGYYMLEMVLLNMIVNLPYFTILHYN